MPSNCLLIVTLQKLLSLLSPYLNRAMPLLYKDHVFLFEIMWVVFTSHNTQHKPVPVEGKCAGKFGVVGSDGSSLMF